ncbi:secondary thiamine-phosphate synthase enzyme YjbQ [Antarctobacter sp.]|uniref:secondary thiamine-phosphate synthase enzyme YjbQ n=1 Tax=Antarctobacter sp. TaxID=1872577 RepID=UPI003A94D272
MPNNVFTIRTDGPGLYEVTDEVARWVAQTGVADGLCTLFLRHTSASLVIQENADPDVRRDLDAFFARLVPDANAPEMAYLTHRYEGPDDMPAHIKAALLPVSLSIPMIGTRLGLGTWQGIYLFEHRSAPHRRDILCHISG